VTRNPPRLPIRQALDPARLASLDARAIGAYNARARNGHRLQAWLGANAFEGDIDAAPVVLLLGNPGFDATSTPRDHAFARPGWPLAGLHPEAPEGLRNWWSARLRQLIEPFGAQHVSQRIACLQLTPWASASFDGGLRLPSRNVILQAATRCIERGALLVVMRGEKLWLEAQGLANHGHLHRAKSWRCSYVSMGNLGPQAWERVRNALAA